MITWLVFFLWISGGRAGAPPARPLQAAELIACLYKPRSMHCIAIHLHHALLSLCAGWPVGSLREGGLSFFSQVSLESESGACIQSRASPALQALLSPAKPAPPFFLLASPPTHTHPFTLNFRRSQPAIRFFRFRQRGSDPSRTSHSPLLLFPPHPHQRPVVYLLLACLQLPACVTHLQLNPSSSPRSLDISLSLECLEPASPQVQKCALELLPRTDPWTVVNELV